ncbi:MAG: crossover junction endodeoxyribonuclease RuvC [Bryobacteraceae bacterium]
MRILGIDCGAAGTGYGVIESDGRVHTLIECGVIRLRTADAFEVRLAAIAAGLRRLMAAHTPEVVAVEEVFHAVNTKSALKLAHVRGVALLVAVEAGASVSEYSPLSVKMSVTGYGRAEKHQVQSMVQSLLRVGAGKFDSFDASDALAVAICHATRATFCSIASTARKGA